MSFQLRDYQREGLDEIRRYLRAGVRSVLWQMPTGAGKTASTAYMLKSAAEKGNRAWFVVHRRELVLQSHRAFKSIGVQHGIIAAGFDLAMRRPVQICSVGTLARRLDRVAAPHLIVWDECITGDSLLVTDIGCVAIRDVPASGATLVLASEDGNPTWRRITAWRNTGKKAVRTLKLSSGRTIRATGNHPVFTASGWKTTGEMMIGDRVLCCPPASDAESWARWLATSRFPTPTSDPEALACTAITELSRPSGARIRRAFFRRSGRASSSRRMPGLVQSMRVLRRLAVHVLSRFMISFGLTAQSAFPSAGYPILGEKASHGGTATTELFFDPRAMRDSIPRGLEKRDLVWPRRSSVIDTERLSSTNSAAGSSSTWTEQVPRGCSPTSDNSSPPACDTSWETVVSACWCDEEDVFDISVESAHNFFANGVLVHNCHHMAAGSWSNIFRQFPNAAHVGLSATPERLDGQGLEPFFRSMVPGPSVRDLITQGFLVPYRLFAPAMGPDLSGVHTRMGDYVKSEVAQVMSKPKVVGDAVEHYRRVAMGRRAVVFAVSIEASHRIVQAFRDAGIPAEHVDGETAPDERDAAIGRFSRGETRVLSNVELFGEGFDLPAIEAVILLRPTQSLAMYLQQVGRGLRTAPGKADCIILDHAGNSARHGLPDDDREWTLAAREVKQRGESGQEESSPIRQCASCFAISPAALLKCRECGEPFPVQARTIEQVEGELQEVAIEEARRVAKREQAQAATLDTLIELGRMRGYKAPEAWARHVWNARQQRRATA